MQPAQVIGKGFVDAVMEHKWRLTRDQIIAKLTEEQKEDPLNSLFFRVMDNQNPHTHGTIVIPAWIYYKSGGFDQSIPQCAEAGRDFAQRMKMIANNGELQRVITDAIVVGKCLVNEPTRWADANDDGAVNNESADAIHESERRLELGEFMRNGGPGVFKSEKYVSVEPSRMYVETHKGIGGISEPRKDNTDASDLSLYEISAELLTHMASQWLRAQGKWDEGPLVAVEDLELMEVAEPAAVVVSKHDCEQLVEISVVDNGFTNNQHGKYKQTNRISQIMICVGDDYWSLKARGSPQDHGPWAQGSIKAGGRVTNPP